MNVKEFVTNKDAVKNIKLETDYVPYIDKVAHCKEIVRVSSHKEVNKHEIFVLDSPTKHLFYIMKMVELYTNIEFENNEIIDAYDILMKNGILNYLFGADGITPIVPMSELVEFKSILDMVTDDMFENERSTTAILDNIKDSLGMAILTTLEGLQNVIDVQDDNQIKIELRNNLEGGEDNGV